MYEADERGDFLVPFSRDATGTTILLLSPARNLVVPRGFSHPAENYRLFAAVILNREAIVRGNKATALIRPSIMLNDVKEVGLQVVDESSLAVAMLDGQGVETVRNVDGFLKGEGEGPERSYDFVVPENCERVRFFPLLPAIDRFSNHQCAPSVSP
jgi:hypothetical protein